MSGVDLVPIQTAKRQPADTYLEPNSPEVIQMKSSVNFTRLPQNPPPGVALYGVDVREGLKPEVPKIIAPVANGTAPHTNYQDGTYDPTGQAMTTFGQMPVQSSQGVSDPRHPRPHSQYRHMYEELPRQMVPDKGRPEENGHSPYSRQMSHTEADQAMLFPRKSPTQVPLTPTDTAERKPRKKLNPIYDGYQGPNKVVKTKGSSKPPQPHHGSPVKQCSSCSVKCLKSPCTTFLVILVVFLMVIAGVLIFMGKITTPATGSSADGLSQPKPSTPDPSQQPMQPSTDAIIQPQALVRMLEEQAQLIEQMQIKIQMLESVLGGSENNVNASLSTKVAQNTFTIEQLTTIQDRQQTEIANLNSLADDAVLQNTNQYGLIHGLTLKTGRLENSTSSLDTRVDQVNAKAATQSLDIRDIKTKNDAQTTQIFNVDSNVNQFEQEYQYKLTTFNRTIHKELEVISKVEGPRGYNGTQGSVGPPGAGNLTMCVYGSQRNANGIEQDTTVTPWVVPGENMKFTGLSCSTDGGTTASLEPDTAPGSFKCVCSGNAEYKDDRFGRVCFIHFWKCPLTS